MEILRLGVVMAAFAFASSEAQADVIIACGGYNPKINDHVEWELTITGTDANLDGEHFKVSETKRFYVLTGLHSEIHIDKPAKSYVTFGPKREKASAVEWSRKVPGEGCEISKK